MNRAGAAVLAVCGTLGGPAAAAPCVGADLETPLPGAAGVQVRHADVPSALFGGTWQQGVLEGLAYQIHANGSAIIGDAPAMAGWRMDMTCDTQARRCDRVATGEAPPASAQVAARIEACLLGPAPAKAAAPNKAPRPSAQGASDAGAAAERTPPAEAGSRKTEAPDPAQETKPLAPGTATDGPAAAREKVSAPDPQPQAASQSEQASAPKQEAPGQTAHREPQPQASGQSQRTEAANPSSAPPEGGLRQDAPS